MILGKVDIKYFFLYIAAGNGKKSKGHKIPLTLRGSYVNRELDFEIRFFLPPFLMYKAMYL